MSDGDRRFGDRGPNLRLILSLPLLLILVADSEPHPDSDPAAGPEGSAVAVTRCVVVAVTPAP